MSKDSKKPSKQYLPGLTALVKEAWHLSLDRFWNYFGVLLLMYLMIFGVLIVAALLLGGAYFAFGRVFEMPLLSIFVVVGVAFLAVTIYISIIMGIALNLVIINDKKQGIRKTISDAKSQIGKYFKTSLLSGFIIMGGFVFFIIPGFIFSFWFSFVTYTVLKEGRSGFSALHTSREYVRGHFWAILWRYLVIYLVPSFIIGFVVGLIFPNQEEVNELANQLSQLVSLLLGPFFASFFYLLYKYVKDTKGKVSEAIPQSTKTTYLVIAILGNILVIVGMMALVNYGLPSFDEFQKSFQESFQQGLPQQTGTILSPTPVYQPSNLR